MTDLDRRGVRFDDPGYLGREVSERRDLLDWLGWLPAVACLFGLIIAVVVLLGF